MIDAYRYLVIPINVDGAKVTVSVPFTMGLLQKVEQVTEATADRPWFRTSKKHDETALKLFHDFSGPYLDQLIEPERAQPFLYALFFSNVRKAVHDSMKECIQSMVSTGGPGEPTEKTTAEAPRSV